MCASSWRHDFVRGDYAHRRQARKRCSRCAWGLEETEAVEQYIQDRFVRQSSEGHEVLWFEVVVRGTTHQHERGPYSARITAHLLDDELLVSQISDDIFLVTRDVFDALGQRLETRKNGRSIQARSIARRT